MSGERVLIVDDDVQFRRVMRKALGNAGYTVTEAHGGKQAVDMLRSAGTDIVLLDMAMPGMSGVETCRAIRVFSDVAVLAISVRSMEKDKIGALDAGADDYITKPFSLAELLARIRAALRRTPLPEDAHPTLQLGDLEINFATRRIQSADREVRLTPKEFELLQFMAVNVNEPLSHRRLLQAVWGREYGDQVVYLRVFVSQLRKKIEVDPRHPRYILTEPCVGYRLRPDK